MPGQKLINAVPFLAVLCLAARSRWQQSEGGSGLAMVLSLLLGVLIVMPIGGADMPVVISLLNSFTGLARRPPASCWATTC